MLAAYRRPRDEDSDGRRRAITAALEAATVVPLAVADVAAEAAVLGGRLAEAGNPNLEGDANAAVELGRAAARGLLFVFWGCVRQARKRIRRYAGESAKCLSLNETANPGKPGDAKPRACTVFDGMAAGPPTRE